MSLSYDNSYLSLNDEDVRQFEYVSNLTTGNNSDSVLLRRSIEYDSKNCTPCEEVCGNASYICPSSWNEPQLFDSKGFEKGSAESDLETETSLALGVAIPMGIVMYFLSLVTVVGNAMVLHAIRTEKRLQTVSNMFIMSLAAADITVGGIVMPISSIYALNGRWVFGTAVCQFWLSADYTASTASILNLFILSMDRYWSITSPLGYLRRRTKKRALIMIGLVWVGSALWILPIIGWHYIETGGKRLYPPTVCETEFANNIVFKVTAACLNFYIPTLLMVYLYGRIYFEIKKRSQFEIGQCNRSSSRAEIRDSKTSTGAGLLAEGQPTVNSKTKSKTVSKKNITSGETYQFRNLTLFGYYEGKPLTDELVHFQGITINVEYIEDEIRTKSSSNGDQSKASNSNSRANSKKLNDSDAVVLQKEKKAARQLGVIMSAFILCWLPYFVLFMVIAFCDDCVHPVVHTVTIWLGYINSTLNPILYPLCNTTFKRAFKKMLGIGVKETSVLMTVASRGVGRLHANSRPGQTNHNYH